MVRILSSGEIVQDDDPRSRQSSASATPRRPEIHRINDQNAEPHFHGPSASIFDTANERLRNLGVPRWNLGPYPVEPIVSVGFLASLLMFGLRGLLFSGLLFGIVKWSQSRSGGGGNTSGRTDSSRPGQHMVRQMRPDDHAPDTSAAQPPNPRNNQGGWPRGSGYRLGRS